ncbi:MAG: PLD nuclease N-terminal domain-containing protein [Bacteroidota bacterium]|jgi:hypothetical protein
MNTLAFFVVGADSMIVLALFILAFPLLALFCLIDIIRSDFKDSTTKLMWVLIVLFAPFLGSIIYLVVGRKSKLLNP